MAQAEAIAARPRPRYFYGWNIVAACFASNWLTTGAYWQGFQVFFLPLVEEFGWSRALFSGAFSFRAVETGIGAPVAGLLVDRWGPRTVLLLSTLIGGIGVVLVGFTWDLFSFYLFFTVASFGASGSSHSVTWAVAIARWFRRKRGTAIGIAVSGPTLAGILLYALELMVQAWGWRTTIMLAGATLLVLQLPMAWFVVRDTPQEMGLHPDGDPTAVPPAPAAGSRVRIADGADYTIKQALRTRNFWLLVAIFSCIFFGHTGIQVHQVAFLHNDVGISTTDAAILVGITFLISGIGRVGAGIVSDFVEVRTVLAGIVLINVTAWGYLNFGPVHDFWTALPFSLLYGIPFGATVSIRPLLMARLFGPRAMGSLVGFFQLATLGAAIIGPVFMGAVYDLAQTYRPSIMAFVFSSALALPFVFLMRPHRAPPDR